jgi:hypothetical protein
MSDLRREKSLAYISSVQFNPKTLHPIQQPIQLSIFGNELRSQNDQLSALMFSDKNSTRTITVSASGEFSLPPDKVKLTALIRSVKSTIDEAKHSTGRRLEYVQQTLKNNSVKVIEILILNLKADIVCFYRINRKQM